jgi:hypothetical protein
LTIGKYLKEFDIKDIVDVSKQQTTLKYDPSLENKLVHNILNGFKQAKTEVAKEAEHKELISKLESPLDESGQVFRRYTITPQGVLLRKGEQIGMFEMGSTVALIFECPKDHEFLFKEG